MKKGKPRKRKNLPSSAVIVTFVGGPRNPQLFRKAMELLYRKQDNANS